MSTVRCLQCLAVVLVCLVSAACLDSDKPLSPPDKAQPDSRLLGAWLAPPDKDGEPSFYHIGQAGGKLPAGMLAIVVVNHDKHGLRSGHMLAWPTTVGEHRWLSVCVVQEKALEELRQKGWDPAKVQGYFLVRYDVTGDKLNVRFIDGKARKTLIETGKIKGDESKNWIMTDSVANIHKLLVSQGDALMAEKPQPLTRVK